MWDRTYDAATATVGQLALTGPFWTAVGSLNDRLGYLGFAVVGIFTLCWIV